jgi:ferredoxin/flavodoxin---NADP+ reductase
VSNQDDVRYYVAVIGAGPAGLFAARELAEHGIHTVLLNRDIKPGGLAEYGIYPGKLKMKEGLRKQFRLVMSLNDIDYYGNVLIGQKGDFTFDDLRGMGFQAMLVTVGAQSVKRLGIPGEDLTGVYHAKDVVYHYNLLPPFSESTYQIGKRVAVVGAGNVMMDITHWLVEEVKVDQVIAVARRGPLEVKFDKKEMETVAGYIDLAALDAELERVRPVVQEIGQDPQELRAAIDVALKKAPAPQSQSKFSMRFLSSPSGMLGDENNQVIGLDVEENRLQMTQDGEVKARGTGAHTVLDVDTVIFAIGDVVDASLGLPVQYGVFVSASSPRFPVEGISYELADPQSGDPVPDIFLAGWARKPSTGLVGIARKDALNATQAILEYLETLPPTFEPVGRRLSAAIANLNHPVVDKSALLRLEAEEKARAQQLGVETFKFASNQEMLEVLGLVTSK